VGWDATQNQNLADSTRESQPRNEATRRNIFADIVDLIADVSIEQSGIIKIKIKIDKQLKA
jgi:hypothetical protein